MYAILFFLVAVSSVSADFPRMIEVLELLEKQLENDFKCLEAQALVDLGNIGKDIQKGLPEIVENPVRGARELAMSLVKDIQQSLASAQKHSRKIKRHIQEAIEAIKKELDPRLIEILELLQMQLENDFKFVEVHAVSDLDNIVSDIQKGLAEMVENPERGARELVMNLAKDIQQGLDWAEGDFREIRNHLQDAIEAIKKELKPAESIV